MKHSDMTDDILLATPAMSGSARPRIMARVGEYPERLVASTVAPNILSNATVDRLDRRGQFVDVGEHRSTTGWSGLAKSGMDYFFATTLLIVLAPVLALIAVLIKLGSPGPVFFRQERHGLNCRKFEILKFRTMYHSDVPETYVRQCTRDDPRVTPIGRFLRRTSLDELPQIFNVLNGTMSLVGPRPHALSHDDKYGQLIGNYYKRNTVKPGITGWAQLNGLRGETRLVSAMARRVEHDIHYINHWSPAFDLRILVATPFVVLSQDSAF